jgi:hypothetical protein
MADEIKTDEVAAENVTVEPVKEVVDQEEKKYTDKDLNDKISARVAKELERARRELLKQAGVKDVEELAKLKELQDAQLTEAEKTAKALAEREAELAEIKQKAMIAEARAEAMVQGIAPEKIERVIKLIGAYEGETTAEKIAGFIKENPEFVKRAGIQDLGVKSGGDTISEEERLLALARKGAGLA